jgi:hypothetical protein
MICDKVYKELTVDKWIVSLVTLKKLEKHIGYLNS